jgi:hypothetical protein
LNRAKAMAEPTIFPAISENNADPVSKSTAKYRREKSTVKPIIKGRKKPKLAKTVSKEKRNACPEANFVKPIQNTTTIICI